MSDLRQQLCVPADTDGATRKEIAPLKDSEDWRSMAYCRSWGGSDRMAAGGWAWQQLEDAAGRGAEGFKLVENSSLLPQG